jgi:polyisoprenoid-binding protein YceI
VGRRALIPLALLALAALSGGLPAQGAAGPAAAGSLGFEAVQAGARFAGRFTQFMARVDFDPTAPAACRFEVTIDTASADTGESQRDELLKGEDFFWSQRYPSAVYRGAGCRRAEPGFALDGELTLRGVTRPVTLVFSPSGAGAGRRLAGTATIERLDFGVGQGEWAATEWVGGEVTVRFDVPLPEGAGQTLP